MGNVINNCFGGGNNGVHFLIEKKFSIDLLRDPNTLLVDLRDWDEYKQKHFRTAVNLPINKIKLTEKKIDISQIFKDSGLRDFIEYFLVNSKQQNDSNEWNDSPYFQIIFYTNEGPVKDALLIQTLYEHREFLRGMSVNCFLLSEGFQKLASEMVGKENEEYFSNTMKYRLKNRNLFINDGTVTEIIENFLLIGSHDNASDTGLLKGFHINNLVNLSEKELDYPPKNAEIKTFMICPNLDSNFLPQLPPIFEYLETMKEKKEKVLLFCENGVRVAASVGLAYLMKSKKWTLLQSFNYLYELQPSVKPSIGFMRHLLEMEAVLFPSLSFPSFPIKCYILFYNQLEDIESNLKFVTSLNDVVNVEEFAVIDDHSSSNNANGEENVKKDDNNNDDKGKEDNKGEENDANDLKDVKENKENNEVKKDDGEKKEDEKKEDNINDDSQN